MALSTHYCVSYQRMPAYENITHRLMLACAADSLIRWFYTVCVLVHDILFQIPLSRKDIYIVASDWSKPLFKQTQGRNKPIRSDYIFPCDSAEFETRYRALIRRRLKPLLDTNKPAAAQAS